VKAYPETKKDIEMIRKYVAKVGDTSFDSLYLDALHRSTTGTSDILK
jgi:hypothetical protein